jgi:hypothetical protein
VQQFQPFRRDLQVRLSHTREVAARPVQAGDEAELDRIGGGFEHDGNGGGRGLCRKDRRSAGFVELRRALVPANSETDWTVVNSPCCRRIKFAKRHRRQNPGQ